METTNQYNPQTVSHPGFTLREKLKELKIGSKEFAIKTDKPEKTITAVLSGKSAITADMALLFETVLKIPAKLWLNRQAKYDEIKARNKRIHAITEAAEWTTKFPYPQMAKNDWVPPTAKKS
ncbi:MAG: HigA family addiction module antidote protein [Chloroflexia bacterium]|nr:HigA family addiction module antidote protein [Chloroflexia bacterium]